MAIWPETSPLRGADGGRSGARAAAPTSHAVAAPKGTQLQPAFPTAAKCASRLACTCQAISAPTPKGKIPCAIEINKPPEPGMPHPRRWFKQSLDLLKPEARFA